MERRAAKRANADAWWETQSHSKDENPGLNVSLHLSTLSVIWLNPQEKGGASPVGDGVQVTA